MTYIDNELQTSRGSSHEDVVCLSHLRWDFVFQRPQHLMTRCARERRVFFVEEPTLAAGPPRLAVTDVRPGVRVLVPHLSPGLAEEDGRAAQRALLTSFFAEQGLRNYIFWYYTPMALGFTRDFAPRAIVYDCMDELSAFAGAPPALRERERELLQRADLVLTGGQSLYEAKRGLHPNVHAFPSSVDVAHFARARHGLPEPEDQRDLPRPRLGFFGVMDERLDIDLVDGIAVARPDWQLVLVGPVAKIEVGTLPRRSNIHYLGPKRYEELPAYLGGWDVALLPFARNEATRYISPTKTPEYLAAGKPVVSTAIRDVVRPYGEQGVVRIADDVPAWVSAIEASLVDEGHVQRERADSLLRHMSWDATWARMKALMNAAVQARGAGVRVPAAA